MTDIVGKDTRSRMMSGIKGKDTKPEMIVRMRLHALGYRYRLHDKRFPGKPDLYFPKYDAAIFVNGCFWHRHYCSYFNWPSTRPEFWRDKLEGNAIRDERNKEYLIGKGIRSLVIWECAIRDKSVTEIDGVIEIAERWLVSGMQSTEIPI
ncbi:MAG: very short patch repair endonuclease [Candidatus Berkelbacteria bacterium]|nr:very short patch repair endonuclease [Candidatus Berkelbacteria bacterium]